VDHREDHREDHHEDHPEDHRVDYPPAADRNNPVEVVAHNLNSSAADLVHLFRNDPVGFVEVVDRNSNSSAGRYLDHDHYFDDHRNS